MSSAMKIPCSSCDHQSDSDLAAFEHWRDNHKRRDGEELGPGLHEVGPEPYGYVFNPAVGQRITAVGLDGRSYTGTVTDVQEDKETGEITLTAAQWPDAPQCPAVSGEAEGKPGK